MEKHCELSSNKYEQQSCTLTPSFKRGRLALFMMCIMVIQTLSDISLEISNSNYFVNLIITGICALSTLSFFLFIEKKTDLFIGKPAFANTLIICCTIILLFQKVILLNLFGIPANKNIAAIVIIICLLFRLTFWIYLAMQGSNKYRSTASFGILTVIISLLGLLTFYQNESIHIDIIKTVLESLMVLFSPIISLFHYSTPIEIKHFYLIGDSILWYLPFITFLLYRDINVKQ